MGTTRSMTKEQARAGRNWRVVDVAGMTLGRAATQIAHILRGKDKPTFTPNADCGDFVIVLNAKQVGLTGRKLEDKLYRRHTGFLGGLVETPANEMLVKHPDHVIRHAVWGMLPKGALGRRIIKKLKIYPGAEHPHEAQQPAPLKLSPDR